MLNDYRLCGREDLDPPLVMKNSPYHVEGAGGEWIGLNPWVGDQLGWTLARDGLLRWIGANAEIMAETIYWVDGPNEMSPYRDDEVGEGYLVLLSPDGAEKLVKRFGPFTRVSKVSRSYLKDGGHTVGLVQ